MGTGVPITPDSYKIKEDGACWPCQLATSARHGQRTHHDIHTPVVGVHPERAGPGPARRTRRDGSFPSKTPAW